MTMEPLEMPTEAPPVPWNTSAFRLIVPDDPCVVLPVAEAVTVPTPRLIVEPFDDADRAPVAERDVSAGPSTMYDPFEMPADTPPLPRRMTEEPAMVPELLCVVLPVA